MKERYILLIPFILLLLVSCAPSNNPLTGEPTLSSDPDTDIMTPTMTSDTPEPAAQELILQAQEHLAQKLNLAKEDIFLFSVEAVEWPDASLGCPQTDISYAQVVTPGYQILLEANGQVYTFHTDTSNRVHLCDAQGPDEIYLPP